MENLRKKKLRFILVGSFITLIVIGFLAYSSILYDNANTSYIKGNSLDNNDQIQNCIKEIDKALVLLPWSKNLNIWKSNLYLKIGNYQEALKPALRIDAFLNAAMIYEYMNETDSAKYYYKKAVNPQIKQIEKQDDFEMKILAERQLALIYNYLGDSIKANEYLKEIPASINYQMSKLIQRFDFYIETSNSGGFKDFLYGKTICMKNDSIQEKQVIDSLIDASRFYYDNFTNRQINGKDVKSVYEFKEIFEDKANAIGFILTECEY